MYPPFTIIDQSMLTASIALRHNPLGKVFTIAELTAIGNLCVFHGPVLLSDEVYERIVYPTTRTQILE
jgi:aspartate/methionine/tyrosine aminotransferase